MNEENKLKSLKRKYEMKYIINVFFMMIFASVKSFIPFIILFIFLEETATILWIGYILLIGASFYLSKKERAKFFQEYEVEKKQLEYETKQQAYYESLPKVKIERFLDNHYDEGINIINEVTNQLKAEYGMSGNFPILPYNMNSISLSPIQTRVDNNQRLEIVKKELEKINHHCDSSSFVSTATSLKRVLSESSIDGVPTAPIIKTLSGYNITEASISRLLSELNRYEMVYQEALSYLDKEVRIMGAGVGGENRVNEELDMYDSMWKSFANVRFEVDGQSVESDNIIVSTKGIFTLEVKNYSPNGNYGIRITKDGQWLKVFSNGNEEPMNNVTSQMNRHIAFKQKLLNQEWKKKYGEASSFQFLPIFVLANDTIRIENETDLPIMRISQIYHHVMKQPDILTATQVEKISEIIQEQMLPAKKYELNQYEAVLEKAYNELSAKMKYVAQINKMTNDYLRKSKERLLEKANLK